LGIDLVAGKTRVPSPATGITAFFMVLIVIINPQIINNFAAPQQLLVAIEISDVQTYFIGFITVSLGSGF
jgi:hypothetical protein